MFLSGIGPLEQHQDFLFEHIIRFLSLSFSNVLFCNAPLAISNKHINPFRTTWFSSVMTTVSCHCYFCKTNTQPHTHSAVLMQRDASSLSLFPLLRCLLSLSGCQPAVYLPILVKCTANKRTHTHMHIHTTFNRPNSAFRCFPCIICVFVVDVTDFVVAGFSPIVVFPMPSYRISHRHTHARRTKPKQLCALCALHSNAQYNV